MRRRSFVLGAAVVLAGCAGSPERDGNSPTAGAEPTSTETASQTPTPTDREGPDCVSPVRPEPTEGSAAVDPATYPDAPSTLDDDAIGSFVTAYERAYRRNDLVERYGRELDRVQLGVGEPRFYDSPPNSSIARLRYTFGYTVGSTIYDSEVNYVSYYVDEDVVVRAEREGHVENETGLTPDPLEGGLVVDCFE